MPDDIIIDMPTDLRSGAHSFEVDFDPAPQAKGLAALTIDIPSSNKFPRPERCSPPRWKTPEFIFYYVVAAVILPIMVWVPIRLSSPSHVNYPFYDHKLSSGWLFGREVDNSDSQYRAFRNNIPALSFLVCIFLAIQSIYTRFALRSISHSLTHRLYLIPFLISFAILFLFGLHGASTLKIIFILTANYYIGKSLGHSRAGPLLTWIFNAAVLFFNEKNAGYRFATIHPSLGVLDAFEGIYPRWHVSFNITMLRLVSFNMDYYWACSSRNIPNSDSALSEKQRANTAHSLEHYSYKNYLAYVLYPPLYIAGPIITFNNFMWQLRRPTEFPTRAILNYFIRFLVCLFTMEFILHYIYVIAIKDAKAWRGDTPMEISMIGFWNLLIVWLKLLIPWRFFRLWALAGGIDPPENMVRCMVNNYSALGFWRSWHRSYNLWIVRYIYIPLGGTKNLAVTTVFVFSFVALWHDLSFRLLAWGWLVSLFILPELLASYLFPPSKHGEKPWYRHVCAMGAILNILMMISANLVGFVIGTDGMLYMVNQITGSWEGLRFLIGACCCIFVGVQFMFEYREEEMRRGIYRRC
ncbi:MBOAT, membrane-bound O-acyltransferase family-domain-containing protein [Hygrophoropsis aurantiaca]|uniref:MBOAT, membrane-bound O-acyltransferase family-domain-containing protein n=1 Tax=Hygrophoropsis aurantiaca TaxID=72124 RepID=A0ACB8A1D9_9AGAM|nr:MBOAT, membrane-bound O-acyltransferase family-domain-containing protein [Hygrophoropsis aurantiaca]